MPPQGSGRPRTRGGQRGTRDTAAHRLLPYVAKSLLCSELGEHRPPGMEAAGPREADPVDNIICLEEGGCSTQSHAGEGSVA